MIWLVLLSWSDLFRLEEGAGRGVVCGVCESTTELGTCKESVRTISDACSSSPSCRFVPSGCDGPKLMLLLHDKGFRSATIITVEKRSGGICTASTFSSAELNASASGSVESSAGRSGEVWNAADWFPSVLTLAPPRESFRFRGFLFVKLLLDQRLGCCLDCWSGNVLS